MDHEFEPLTEKETMWAEMLMEVLQNNQIPCTALPVHGVGFVMKTGAPERLRIFVPASDMDKAKDLMQILFSEE